MAGALLPVGAAAADSARAEVEIRASSRVVAARRAVFGAASVSAETGEPRRDAVLIAPLAPSAVAVALNGMVIVVHPRQPAAPPTERELERAAALAPAIVMLAGLDARGALSAPGVARTGAALVGTSAQCVALGTRDPAAGARCHAPGPAVEGGLVVARIVVSTVDLTTRYGRPVPAWRLDSGGRSVLWHQRSVEHRHSKRRCDNAVAVVRATRSVVPRLPCSSRTYDLTT